MTFPNFRTLMLDEHEACNRLFSALRLNGIGFLTKRVRAQVELTVDCTQAHRVCRVLDRHVDFGAASAAECLDIVLENKP